MPRPAFILRSLTLLLTVMIGAGPSLAEKAALDWTQITSGPIGSSFGTIGAAWGDTDGDGDDDILLATEYHGIRLLRNDGADVFTDATPSVMNNTQTYRCVVLADYDNDGDLDAYGVRGAPNGANRLFRNDGGLGWADATTPPLDNTGDGACASWVDYDGDGILDIFLANTSNQSDRLFRGSGGGLFSNQTPSPMTLSRDAGGQAWCDFDDDGDQDLAQALGWDGLRLLRNDGGGVFTDVTTTQMAAIGDKTASVSWADYDNDLDFDLYVTVITAGEGGHNTLFHNDGGIFFESADPLLSPTGGYKDASWGDFDNDGDLDLYFVTNSGSDHLLHNNGDGTFVEDTPAVLDVAATSSNATACDYDLDGDLDIYLGTYPDRTNRLFRNDLSGDNHWFELVLVGTISNRSAIGARVTLTAGGLTQVREVTNCVGHLSQNPLAIHFGLGSATTIEGLTIRWPSGSVDHYDGLWTDMRYTITEDGLVPTYLEDYSVTARENGVELRWSLRDGSTDSPCFVFRRCDRSEQYVQLDLSSSSNGYMSWMAVDRDVVPGLSYQYRVETEGPSGNIVLFETAVIDIPACGFSLAQNSPNPFNPVTKINYSLDEPSLVKLVVYDIAGHRVRTLIDAVPAGVGRHSVTWDGTTDAGLIAPAGEYFYRLEAGLKCAVGRMLMVK